MCTVHTRTGRTKRACNARLYELTSLFFSQCPIFALICFDFMVTTWSFDPLKVRLECLFPKFRADLGENNTISEPAVNFRSLCGAKKSHCVGSKIPCTRNSLSSLTSLPSVRKIFNHFQAHALATPPQKHVNRTDCTEVFATCRHSRPFFTPAAKKTFVERRMWYLFSGFYNLRLKMMLLCVA